MNQPLIVTAAIIRNEDKVLITRRPQGNRHGGKWEFPGGKLDSDESPEECLYRELLEELNLPVNVGPIFNVLYHRYSWGNVLLLFYECTPLAETIENKEVAEHKFVSIAELHRFDFLEADLPLIAHLKNLKTTDLTSR